MTALIYVIRPLITLNARRLLLNGDSIMIVICEVKDAQRVTITVTIAPKMTLPSIAARCLPLS
jgi:hypothetical protein